MKSRIFTIFLWKHSQLNQEAVLLFWKKGKATTETNKSHWIPFYHSPAETVNVNLWDNDLLLFRRKSESWVKDELCLLVKLVFPNRKAPPDRTPQTVVRRHPDVSQPCRTHNNPHEARTRISCRRKVKRTVKKFDQNVILIWNDCLRPHLVLGKRFLYYSLIWQCKYFVRVRNLSARICSSGK